MKLSLWLAGILLTVTCVLMFVLVLDAKAFRDQSLAVLNAFLAYPIVAYSIFSFYQVLLSLLHPAVAGWPAMLCAVLSRRLYVVDS